MTRHLLTIGCLFLLCISAQCDEVTGWALVNTAMQYKGCRYQMGATGPNVFDCSAFVRYCYAQHGYDLPRQSRGLALCGTKVIGGKDDLQAGDILIFGIGHVNHVGIYIAKRGNKHEFIHCATSKGVSISALEDNYWSIRYMGGRRILQVECECTDVGYAEKSDVGNGPIVPQIDIGEAPIAAQSDIGTAPIPTTKHWKTQVKRKNRKQIVFANGSAQK